MKTARYVQAERTIVKADAGGIRERWIWGLRLLHDPTAISAGGGGLRHGVAAELIAAAEKAGLKLSEQEIQRRLRCARAYPQESQIRISTTDLRTWTDLVQAGFPQVPEVQGEMSFDWRTPDERRHQMAQLLAAGTSGQEAFSFFQDFDPVVATLADLRTYAVEQLEMAKSFLAHAMARMTYLEELERAASGNMTMTWQQAHQLARPGVPLC